MHHFFKLLFFYRQLKTFSARKMKNDMMRLKTQNSVFKNVNTLTTLNLREEMTDFSCVYYLYHKNKNI